MEREKQRRILFSQQTAKKKTERRFDYYLKFCRTAITALKSEGVEKTKKEHVEQMCKKLLHEAVLISSGHPDANADQPLRGCSPCFS